MYTDVYTCKLYCVCTYLFIQALDRELETHLGGGDPPVPKTTSPNESLQPVSELCNRIMCYKLVQCSCTYVVALASHLKMMGL